MKFVSLGEGHVEASFAEALRQGVAPDGSLYFPEYIPELSLDVIDNLHQSDMNATALAVLNPWLSDEIPLEDLKQIVDQAATFDTPLRRVGDKQVLELFHGPTLAFKDVAARYLAALMSYFNKMDGYESRVLVATSGDTGGAIAHGFANVAGVDVTILFPKGKVSELQREQLVRTANNVNAYEVDGNFDDCQALVKQALGDAALKGLRLSSANSISVGRLLPQMIYYARAYGQLPPGDRARFVVPTGNLGNLSAGLLALRMGIPVEQFLAANNANRAVTDYLETGIDVRLETVTTLSNAMDVGAPNNMPRFIQMFGNNVEAARQIVQATVIDDELTIKTIQRVHRETGYLLDPHTAVAWAASERLPVKTGLQDIIVSTASPVKFSSEILKATGIEISNRDELEALRTKPAHVAQLSNTYAAFKQALLSL